jgi:hypothetical protein
MKGLPKPSTKYIYAFHQQSHFLTHWARLMTPKRHRHKQGKDSAKFGGEEIEQSFKGGHTIMTNAWRDMKFDGLHNSSVKTDMQFAK